MRIKLRNKMLDMYGTQDNCAYNLQLSPAIVSRIIGCTKDPNAKELTLLSKRLHLTEEEVLEKDE